MTEEFVLAPRDKEKYAPSSLSLSTGIHVDNELIKECEAIPDKMAFKIGEVADLVGVKSYVLRYWESEFDALRPIKSKNNQRMYKKNDVITALMIKKLLYRDKFSIAGARKALNSLKKDFKKKKELKNAAERIEGVCLKLDALLGRIESLKKLFL